MISNIECPNCLGTGEAFRYRKVSMCKTCEGAGTVNEDEESHYLNEVIPSHYID